MSKSVGPKRGKEDRLAAISEDRPLVRVEHSADIRKSGGSGLWCRPLQYIRACLWPPVAAVAVN